MATLAGPEDPETIGPLPDRSLSPVERPLAKHMLLSQAESGSSSFFFF